MSSDTWAAEAVRRAARWLPHQGPLEVFVHHNTLSELEDRISGAGERALALEIDLFESLVAAVLAAAHPGREIVPVPCRSLIWQNGSLHCISMQLPAGCLATA